MLDSLANVKSRLGISGTTYDTFLTQQIQMISDVIERYCRRKFLATEYQQTFYPEDNRSSTLMTLYHYPVIEVASITQDEVAMEDSFFRLNKDTGIIRNLVGQFFTYDETVVTYTAGYATCPAPVLEVLDGIIQERYNKKVAGIGLNFGSDVQRISIPGTISIDFDYSLESNTRKSAYGAILGNYANILDDWRSERAVIGNDKLTYLVEGDEVVVTEGWQVETFVLDADDITNGYIDLDHVAVANTVSMSGSGYGNFIEGASYDYSVDLTGGANSKTRITFLNDLAVGAGALEAGDILQVRYESELEAE